MNIANLEAAICRKEYAHLTETQIQIFELYHSQQYLDCIRRISPLLDSEIDMGTRAFYLHMQCAIFEILYDLQSRTICMKNLFESISHTNDFAMIAFRYHEAVTCYFESRYVEAKQKFEDIIALASAAPRFAALSHFHLGLIFINRNLSRGAFKEFDKSLHYARELSHLSLIEKINFQKKMLKNGMQFPLLDHQLQGLIGENYILEARKFYLSKRKQEREKKLNRYRNTLHSILPAILYKLNKEDRLILKVICLIRDPSVKEQSIGYLQSLGFESPHLKTIRSFLHDQLGVSPLDSVVCQQSNSNLIKLHLISAQDDLKRFAELLTKKDSIDKSQICTYVWGIEYDPLHHDSKVYKLIHRFRDKVGHKDIVVNKYGRYEMNQKYRA